MSNNPLKNTAYEKNRSCYGYLSQAARIVVLYYSFPIKHHPDGFYLRKVRKSAKIFRRINKMTIFAEEKCGNPQKSFVSYGYREK